MFKVASRKPNHTTLMGCQAALGLALIAALTIGGCPDSSSDSTGDPERRVARDESERPNVETRAAPSEAENPLVSARSDDGSNPENAPRDPTGTVDPPAVDPDPEEARSADPTGDDPGDSGQGDGPVTVGVYVVTYDATDACGNRAQQVTRVVEVVDTIPPEVTVGPLVLLWPPDHEYRTLNLSNCVESVVDLCEGALEVNEVGTILSIYSDEPENARGGGDGHTLDDIVLVGNSSFMVRAERQGGGNGRVYGITFQVVDASGNITETTCFVGVQHDQASGSPIDDGPAAGYTVP